LTFNIFQLAWHCEKKRLTVRLAKLRGSEPRLM
jgi:hypothetical protein